ncbi:GspH/FimT family pseudopilin [Haliea sp. E1-2-M8]|uniref:GspH/FimT family pseudopilin n=1 Tax=Haliea sp. E1-2-M8 TaxID=3064706 RepID=UPI00271CE45E|nr:GspH/FimT family pseudopilin [Haliea sp. E1-2-M8]MDO8862484.1 GspH/FimT family pseudopilin [Haliea sp. E1-2-M8]
MSIRKPARGLTLVELMLVLALLGIFTVVAVPGFQSLQQRTQMRAEATRLLVALNLARSEAVRRNLPVSLCPSRYAVSGVLACDGDYRGGWIVFNNPGRDLEIGPNSLIQAYLPMHPQLQLSNRSGTLLADELITFMPDGSAGRNRTLMICSRAQPGLASWSLVMNIVGRSRLVRGWGECPREALA